MVGSTPAPTSKVTSSRCRKLPATSTSPLIVDSRRAGCALEQRAALDLPSRATVSIFSVTLVSSDFDTPNHPQMLTVARDGKSKGRALFECTPRHDGPSTISVLVDVAGNFLQRLEVTFDVGAGAEPSVTNSAAGRSRSGA